MPPELAPWISPAIIVGFMLYLNPRLESRMDRIESQIGELRERVAHLEGLLEGLREAITRRRIA